MQYELLIYCYIQPLIVKVKLKILICTLYLALVSEEAR